LDKLLKYISNKESGGARTAHQINQVFNLLTYCFEIYANKVKDSDIIRLDSEDLEKLTRGIIDNIKYNLKDEGDIKRSKMFFIGLINLFDKLLLIIKKGNIETTDKLGKNVKSIANAFEKVVEKFELKNMEGKVKEMKNRIV
jgi:hypothetical protein